MPTYVALLRGINVGGKNKVPMAELRAVFEALGHSDVRTYIQSGNVVFSGPKAPTPATLEKAIGAEFGIDLTVVVRTPAQLSAAVGKKNPFPTANTSALHIGFMAEAPAAAAVKALDRERFLPEEFAVVGSDLYLHLPDGMGRTKLPPYLDRQLKVPTTVRNWNTVTKLVELAAS
ncbi:MAG TPA: DUF1697 domain-containing protein [Acidimicrobiales bacterium]|nr:DUF1697 domain-containing protein [Acidimicrobiales bacterium]